MVDGGRGPRRWFAAQRLDEAEVIEVLAEPQDVPEPPRRAGAAGENAQPPGVPGDLVEEDRRRLGHVVAQPGDRAEFEIPVSALDPPQLAGGLDGVEIGTQA